MRLSALIFIGPPNIVQQCRGIHHVARNLWTMHIGRRIDYHRATIRRIATRQRVGIRRRNATLQQDSPGDARNIQEVLQVMAAKRPVALSALQSAISP